MGSPGRRAEFDGWVTVVVAVDGLPVETVGRAGRKRQRQVGVELHISRTSRIMSESNGIRGVNFCWELSHTALGAVGNARVHAEVSLPVRAVWTPCGPGEVIELYSPVPAVFEYH